MDSKASCLLMCVLKESDAVHILEDEFSYDSGSSCILGCDGHNEKWRHIRKTFSTFSYSILCNT
jgi:hypothetical protein